MPVPDLNRALPLLHKEGDPPLPEHMDRHPQGPHVQGDVGAHGEFPVGRLLRHTLPGEVRIQGQPEGTPQLDRKSVV